MGWYSDANGLDALMIAVDLNGYIIEYDLHALLVRRSIKACDSPIWSCIKDPFSKVESRFALACDDGRVRIITLKLGKTLIHNCCSLPVSHARVSSVAWPGKGDSIIAGDSMGKICCWNLDVQREIFKISSTGGRQIDHLIWSLVVLPDDTVVSGDSAGNIGWYNGSHGTQICVLRQHNADVTALAATSNGQRVFSSGVDRQVAYFSRLKSTEKNAFGVWSCIKTKRAHIDIINALALINDVLLISGGYDGLVMAYSVSAYSESCPTRVFSLKQELH
jgi:U3 small nucleolar RNA-associated protein 4